MDNKFNKVADDSPVRLACFISPHGFGHAARASAILRACADRCPELRVDLFTQVPTWFFDESIPGLFDYHPTVSDVGFVQRSALEIDFPATLQALSQFIPFDRDRVARLAETLAEGGCRAVLCDISPLGIAVARAAGLPSILIENFTWDWLYEPYEQAFPAVRYYWDCLQRIFASADYHVQTMPYCVAAEFADLVAAPVARPAGLERSAVRRHLGVQDEEPLVVITMGGIPEPLAFLPRLREFSHVRFLITGCTEDLRDGNLIQIDQRTRVYLPDMIRASDAVIAKLGYSTVAEVWTERKPLAYVVRDFRESATLKEFVTEEIPGFEISADSFQAGEWIHRVEDLLELPIPECRPETGAEVVAEYILNVAGGGGEGRPKSRRDHTVGAGTTS